MLSASLSVKISEGYGLTETCLAASISLIDSLGILSNDGDVGKPLPCYEIKLKDVEGIYTKDDKPFARGQIFVRGHNLFKGNFIPGTQTEDERIHSPLDSSGWFGTGDIGYFDET
ncbi:AMP-dependent synthetase/ligase [Phakopsora pachyrhizi]|nr:AMP-dependent synthetase/ligase [Phakopsora pachyrhizi]